MWDILAWPVLRGAPPTVNPKRFDKALCSRRGAKHGREHAQGIRCTGARQLFGRPGAMLVRLVRLQ